MRHRAARRTLTGAAGVLLAALLAGCLGGRGGRGAPAPPPADSLGAGGDAAAAVTPPDSAPAAGDREGVARADSLAAIGRAAADSAAQDTIVRGDTARGDRPRTDSVPVARAEPAARECVLDLTQSPPESRLVTTRLTDGSRTTFIGGGVVAQCQGDPQVISADSLEHYEAAQLLILRGNAKVEEPGRFVLAAPMITYFQREEKLVADGGVVVTDVPTGSTLMSPTLEYFRAIPGSRPFPRLFAPNRPVATLIERDSAGVEQPPVTVTANYMEDRGTDTLAAWGRVEVLRGTIIGESDSAAFAKATGHARLLRNASIVSRDTAQPFRLVGDTIDLFTTDRVLERVEARHRATATQEALRLAAERIDLRLEEQRLRRAFAFGDGRASAETPEQALEADSIAVELPAQRVEALVAVGTAVATGAPDTMRIRSEERDVLRGDTVIARFDTIRHVGDTAARSVLREVRAIGQASSLYQVPSQRGPTFPPAINYVTGWRITVAFDTGTVRTVAVDSQASGVYLEPEPDSTVRDSVRPDSARPGAARPDTASTNAVAAATPRPAPSPPPVPVRPRRSSSMVLVRTARTSAPRRRRAFRRSPLRIPPLP